MDLRGGLRGWRLVAAVAAVLALALLFGGGAAWIQSAQRGRDRRGRDRQNGAEQQTPLAQQARVTPDQARAAALAAVPGTVRALRLQREGGALRYVVLVQASGQSQATEVQVDATSGNVVQTGPADPEDDDDGG